MDFYISRDPAADSLGDSLGDGVPDVPRDLLARHGARAPESGDRRASAYRTDALRIPRSADRAAVERSLADVNLTLAGTGDDPPGRGPAVVRLAARDPSRPATVDAWYALGHLRRAAADAGGDLATAIGEPDPIGLEHLLFVGIGPAPWDSHSAGPAPWDSHSVDPVPWDSHGLFSTDSYVRSARGGPVPISVAFRPATPRPLARGGFDRRPVVAVLDTGIAGHEWFGTTDRPSGLPPGGFIRELKEVQDAITASSRESGVTPARVIEDYWDTDVPANPLTAVLGQHAGHGTFVAGLVRQIAPDAELAIARVMAGDGVAYESDLLAALEKLVDQVKAAQAPGGNPADMIDILSLSMGYYIESAQDADETRDFTRLLHELADLGVLVVAAAGNNATARRFYPAALATKTPPGGGQAVLSVGALNPNGSKAFFSNQASWVRAWATGAAVVSTFPKLRGSMGPAQVIRELDRESMDPDDFTSGFALWHGTSFAAPQAAAVLANKLVAQADADPARLRMGDVSREAMLERVRLAVESCPPPDRRA